MGCGNYNGCGCDCSCETEVECESICSALTVTNSWNVPSCGNNAVLSVPGLEVALVGAYVWNPAYGYFRIYAFDSTNYQLTVTNECTDGNADAGTVVPADTLFVFGSPPGSTSVTYETVASGAGYTLTSSLAPVVFGTVSPTITLTIPGTYQLFGYFSVNANSLTNAAWITVDGGFYRTNNTPTSITALSLFGVQPLTAITSTLSVNNIPTAFYTTNNTTDIITLQGRYSGTIGSGSLVSLASAIRAVKLS